MIVLTLLSAVLVLGCAVAAVRSHLQFSRAIQKAHDAIAHGFRPHDPILPTYHGIEPLVLEEPATHYAGVMLDPSSDETLERWMHEAAHKETLLEFCERVGHEEHLARREQQRQDTAREREKAAVEQLERERAVMHAENARRQAEHDAAEAYWYEAELHARAAETPEQRQRREIAAAKDQRRYYGSAILSSSCLPSPELHGYGETSEEFQRRLQRRQLPPWIAVP